MAANPALLFRIDGDASGFNRAAMSVEGNVTKLGNVFNDVFAGGLATEAVMALTNQLRAGGEAIFNYTSKLEQSKIGFTTVMRSADLAASHIADLEKLSRSSPLKFENIATMSQRLQGAGIEAQKIIPLIKDIGNVAAATGELSADRMEGIGVAFSQILSKGKVSAEEMEQLAERGIPAWKILSESINKTAAETRKMAEDGKISGQQMLEAFQKFSRANFGDAMQKQAQTFSGAWAVIENNAIQGASKAFEPIYKEISQFVSKAAKSLKDQEAEAKQTGVSLGQAYGYAFGDAYQRAVAEKVQDRGWLRSLFDLTIGAAYDLGVNIARGTRKGIEDASDPVQHFGTHLDRYGSEMQRYQKERDRYLGIINGRGGNAGTADFDAKEAERLAKERERERKQKADEERRRLEDLARRNFSAALGGANNNLQGSRDDMGDTVTDMIAKLEEFGSGENVITFLNKEFVRLKNNLDITLDTLESIENQQRANNTEAENSLLTQNQRIRRDAEESALEESRAKFKRGVAAFDEEQGRKAAERNSLALLQTKALMELEEMRAMRQLEIQSMLSGVASTLATPTLSAEGDGTTPGLFDGWKASWQDFVGYFSETAPTLGSMMTDFAGILQNAFQGFASAVGSLVQNLVLMGTTGPAVARKMLASVLASIAAESAVRAIFELAKGFAAMFLNPPQAAAHFKAAALFGSIAVGSGLAGRAVAGNAFQNNTSGGGGSGGDGDADNGNRPGLAFTTRFNGFLTDQQKRADTMITSVMEKTNAVMGRVGEQIDKFSQTFGVATPGDVVMAGAGAASGAIYEAHLNEIRGDGGKATELKRGMGDYS
jgi:tape measure domain-containing protein